MPALANDDLLGSPSPLDRAITVTQFRDAGANTLTARTLTARDLAAAIGKARAPDKGALPWIKLATFGDVRTSKGSLRHDSNVAAISGIEGDYDGGAIGVDEARAKLSAAGVAAIIYTSASHTLARPRWRVLAPLATDHAPDARDALCARLNGALGGILAPESFTRSQAYFYGRVDGAADYRVEVIEGRAIDELPGLPTIGRRGDGTATPTPANDDSDDDEEWWRPEPSWSRIESALATISADGRDDWLTVGMALHAEGQGGAEARAVWDEWSRSSDKFDPRDQERTWKAFGRRDGDTVAIGTLYRLAKSYGWSEAPASSPKTPSRLTFLSPDECAAAPSRGYVVKGLLAPGDVGCIFGAPGAGKSLIAPFIGYQVARGAPAFGMRTRPGVVFYVAAEDPFGMQGRVAALKIEHGEAPRFVLIQGVSDLLAKGAPDLAALLAAIEDRTPALIFVDTLAMAFPGLEENSADGMGRVVAVARLLAKGGAAVALIHHDTKAEGSTPRGHSLLNGALDMALHLRGQDEQGVVRGRLTKNRNGGDRRFAFRIDSREVGTDDDGDPVTAALVAELAPGAAPARERLTASESAALATLVALRAAGEVAEEDWRTACIDGRSVSAAAERESRRKAVKRAFEGLIRKSAAEIISGRCEPLSGKIDDCGFDD
jgi:hypothetical protein